MQSTWHQTDMQKNAIQSILKGAIDLFNNISDLHSRVYLTVEDKAKQYTRTTLIYSLLGYIYIYILQLAKSIRIALWNTYRKTLELKRFHVSRLQEAELHLIQKFLSSDKLTEEEKEGEKCFS